MEQTAFPQMSRSHFRTVTTTFFQLDSGDVIRAKDRQAMARKMSKSRESRASTGGQGQASTSHVGTKTAEMSSKHPEPMQEEDQVSFYKNMPLQEDSSQLAKIARVARATHVDEAATEHAIPGIRQIQSESISDLTKDIKSTENQAVETSATLTVSENDPSQKPTAAIDTYADPPQSSPKRNSSSKVVRDSIPKPKATRRSLRKSHPPAQASLEQSGPRRSAWKTSTSHTTAEVDWSEGIRPTDDETSPKDKKEADKRGSSRGTSVSSPDAGSDKSSRKKRKAPKVKPDSTKRRKAIKKKSSTSAQLPLTANIDDKCQPETEVDADPALELPDGRLDNTCTRDAEMQAASFPIMDKRDDELEAVSSRNEITELLSDSLLQPNLSSPRQGTASPRSNGQTAMANLRGRGVTVGQKLTDAFREAELSSQHPPDVESRFSPTGFTVGGTASELPRSHFTLPNHVSPAKDPFSSELGMVKDELSATSSAGEQKSLNEPDEISTTRAQKHQTTGVSPRIVVPPARRLSDTQKLLHFAGILGRKADGDDAENPMVIPDDSSVAQLSDAMEMDQMQRPHAAQDNPQASLQRLEDDLETSSLSSEIPLPDGITMLPVQGGESEHTPESQKPLLSVHTHRQQIAPLTVPKSITRSSIVDRNGSPRLCPQTDIKTGKSLLNIDDFLQNIRITDSSSSEYDENSDGYHSESKYQSGGGWSKYQRDMFMEYGIGPEELTTDMTGPALFGDAVKVASHADQISKATCADVTELPHEDKREDCNLVGSGATRNVRASGISSRSVPRSIDAPRMEASHDAENFEKRLSMLMQNDLSNMNWITDLQAAQQSAHNLLLATNQNLSSQLAAEQDTIRQVLQIYRQGCNRILDDLFRAQEVRMRLYRQQISSVKQQHTQICQELIQGLQELDHRVQQEP